MHVVRVSRSIIKLKAYFDIKPTGLFFMKLKIFFLSILFSIPSVSTALPVQFEDGDSFQSGLSFDESGKLLEQQNSGSLIAPENENSKSEIIEKLNKTNRFLDDLKQKPAQENELQQMELELLKGQVAQFGDVDKSSGSKNNTHDKQSEKKGLYFLAEPVLDDPAIRQKAKEILEITKDVHEVISVPGKPEVADGGKQSLRNVSQLEANDDASEELYQNIKWTIIYLLIGLVVFKLLMQVFSTAGSGNKKYRRRRAS